MHYLKKRSRYSAAGFTLIELLLVTAIISLLSSVLFFNVTEARKKGDDGKMKAQTQQISTAVALYKEDNNGKAPGWSNPSIAGNTVYEGDEDGAFVTALSELVPDYISTVPTSPSGDSYSYFVSQDGLSAVFSAVLNNPNGSGGQGNYCEASASAPGAINYRADGDEDGDEDDDDRDLFIASFYSRVGDANFIAKYDYNNDSAINTLDYSSFNYHHGAYHVGPSAPAEDAICSGSALNEFCACI